MQAELAARNVAMGWAKIPHTAPEHIRARIMEKRATMLNRRRANSPAPAAPALAADSISDELLAARLNRLKQESL